MKNKLTLNEAWKACLKMWKWIAEQKLKSDYKDVVDLKKEWFERQKKYSAKKIRAQCFFCEYTNQNNTSCDCVSCPGKLVDERFFCTDETYNYYFEPVKFYQKILQLDAKRRG